VAEPSNFESTFARLLANEAPRKPNYPLFESGYRETLARLQAGGTFTFEGMELTVPAGVYAPRAGSSTEFVSRNWWAAHLDEPKGSLLELGAGSGALTLLAARQGWCATGADIDAAAVSSAQENAARNGIEAEFRQSDLFEAFKGERFDVILFNQPYFHKPEVQDHERALADLNGHLTQRMLDEAARHLNAGGRLVFTYSNCSHAHLLERSDWSFQIAGCDYEARGRYWRTLLVGHPVEGTRAQSDAPPAVAACPA